jgi:hypothetical protein
MRVEVRGKSPLRSTLPDRTINGASKYVWRMRLAQTLWCVTREFNVSTTAMSFEKNLPRSGAIVDHLCDLCEKTVRGDEKGSGVRSGKQRMGWASTVGTLGDEMINA